MFLGVLSSNVTARLAVRRDVRQDVIERVRHYFRFSTLSLSRELTDPDVSVRRPAERCLFYDRSLVTPNSVCLLTRVRNGNLCQASTIIMRGVGLTGLLYDFL